MSPPVRQWPNDADRRGAVAVILREERFLVIRRSRLVAAPLAYCFPGGGIEADETEAEALVRELQEELGLLVTPLRRVWQSRTRWGVSLAWWHAEIDPAAVPVPSPAEVESVHWYAADELARLEGLLESNREFLAALAAGAIVLG